jgi:hypothetical protein
MAAVATSLFFYSQSVTVVSMCCAFVIGFAALLCSSLPTPLYGYPFFLLGLLSFGACWLIRQNRLAKHADRGYAPTTISIKNTLGRSVKFNLVFHFFPPFYHFIFIFIAFV